MQMSKVTPPLPSTIAATDNPFLSHLESNETSDRKIRLLRQKAERQIDRVIEHKQSMGDRLTGARYTIPLRYPSPNEIVRIAPENRLRAHGWPTLADPATGDVYLVAPNVLRRSSTEISDMAVWIGFALAVSSSGASFLWPYPVNVGEGLDAESVIEEARTRWVRVIIDRAAGNYYLNPKAAEFHMPRWPRLEHDDVIDIVFGRGGEPDDREICSLFHPVMKRIRGEAAA